MKRLFAALKINPDKDFLNQLQQLKDKFRHERIKWVEEHNIHVTLKFLGETDEKKIPDIVRILEAVAGETPDFAFSLKNLGIFGSSYDPRVIWAGIEPFEELASLMRVTREKMAAIGFEPDRQNLVPHLTLGRIKALNDKKLFQTILDQNKSISSQEMKAGSIILYESILKKEGPVYAALQTFQLRKKLL
jgi:2'-5' RNA ligase